MAQRNYTKYNVEGLGENLNKRQLVSTIVKDWAEKNKPTLEELQKVFPDEIQGSKGVVKKEVDIKDPKRYNMKEPIKIKNGAHVVVSNQWGDNIEGFIAASEKLGYQTSKKENAMNKESGENTDSLNDSDNQDLKHYPYPEFSTKEELTDWVYEFEVPTRNYDFTEAYEKLFGDAYNLSIYDDPDTFDEAFFEVLGLNVDLIIDSINDWWKNLDDEGKTFYKEELDELDESEPDDLLGAICFGEISYSKSSPNFIDNFSSSETQKTIFCLFVATVAKWLWYSTYNEIAPNTWNGFNLRS